MRVRVLIFPILILITGLLFAKQPRANLDPKGLGGSLKTYDSPVYVVYTDVPLDDAKEAVIRMNKMAEEYHERTKGLFLGSINQKLPFYLFAKPQDYYEGGGMPGSAGVFDGESLMAMVIRDPRNGRIGLETWHIVQHEGFHQFVHFVVGGDIPAWVNEGLAEYFGEGIFTGDGIVTGIIPSRRLERVKAELSLDALKSIKGMMQTSRQGWNGELKMTNYDQAWSMVHFLAQADNGKYQDAFARFLQIVGRGKDWETAWIASFGSVEGFEQKWKEYWLKMPENPTADLYAKADVAALTSFLGRAYSQKQTFDTFDEFIKSDAKDLKAAEAEWLPPALYTVMKSTAQWLKGQGAEFSLSPRKGAPPQIVCVLSDGTRITGTCTLKGNRIAKVTADIGDATLATTKPAKH